MIAQYRLYLEIAAAVALLAVFAWFVHHERDLGASNEKAAVNAAIVATQERLQAEFKAKAKTSQVIGEDFHAAITAPVAAPVVRIVRVHDNAVCSNVVPETASTASGDHAATPSGAADSIDIGAPLVTVGRNSDAQVKALEAYITQVCLK